MSESHSVMQGKVSMTVSSRFFCPFFPFLRKVQERIGGRIARKNRRKMYAQSLDGSLMHQGLREGKSMKRKGEGRGIVVES